MTDFTKGDLACWRWSIGTLISPPTLLRVWRVTKDHVFTTSVNTANHFTDQPSDLCTPVEWYAEACQKAGSDTISAYLNNGDAFCLDCFLSRVLKSDLDTMHRFYLCLQQDRVTDAPGVDDTITEYTVQYESWPGQIIPKEGVVCSGCFEELYPPYDDDPLDGRITQAERI